MESVAAIVEKSKHKKELLQAKNIVLWSLDHKMLVGSFEETYY